MNRYRYFKIPLVILTFAAIQRSQIGTLTISSVHPDLLLAGTIFLGLTEGREVGAVVGFIFGLFADSFASVPFGVSSLVYAVMGYIAGMVEVTTFPDSRLVDTAIVAITAGGGEAFLGALLNVLGINTLFDQKFTEVVLVATLLTVVLSVPVVPLLRWVLAMGTEERPPSRRGIRD